MIKVLIADDQELIRQSLQIVLDSKPDIEVSDVAADGQEVIRCIRKQKPDVILMDIRMPKMDGVQCTKIIKENYPDRTLLIAAHRVSSVADCDEILYMQDGEIIERGTFDQLIAANGRFAAIYKMQTSEEGKKDDFSDEILASGREE